MAGTQAPRRKRAKQKMIPGTEQETVKEVEDAAENYVKARDERMVLTEFEVKAKDKLIEVMRKYDLSIYKFEDYTVTLDHVEKDDVKVKKAKQPGEESNGQANDD